MGSLFQNFRLLSGARTPGGAGASAARNFWETSRFVSVFIFVLTVAAIVLISFVDVSTVALSVLPHQVAHVRVTASAPFTYESPLKTEQGRARLITRVPPAYKIDLTPYFNFETHVRDLLANLARHGQSQPKNPGFAPRLGVPPGVAEITAAFNAKGPYNVAPDDVAAFLAAGDATKRASLLETGLAALREIYHQGVHDDLNTGVPESGAISLLQLRRPDGEVAEARVQSLEEALTYLRVNLATEGLGREATRSLFNLFRAGLSPNLVYDREATERLQQRALATFKPIAVAVESGQAIIEPGARVTPEQYEMFQAHRQFLLHSGRAATDDSLQILRRILLVLAMVMASAFYIRLEDPETLQSNVRLGLLALVVILNLALVRLTYALASLPYFVENFSAAALLPYVAPTAFAPLIVAILIDAGSGIFMALLVSIFTSVIYGNRLDLLVITFLASMVGIFSSRDVRKRSRVVKAAGLGGVTVACFALLIGIADQVPPETIVKQMLAGVATGLGTGIVVAGLLPVFESLFQRTTDITFLELTDFNHPLLRLMQLEAPGTYHHSLMVAQLAENAANSIGANPLLARVCSLFHDIGKTTRPEFFTENQRDRANPHDQQSPAHSALIIKGHVKEGVDLALKHHLPRAVIDVIQQHHGTALIQYFYQRAKSGSRTPLAVGKPDSGPPLEVAESTYRYDGPRPQFKESAIIMLADAVEAASRSLRQVTPHHLGETIDRIVADRVADGQLDEAPLTFEDVGKIKTSFTFTLLNMLHSRVAYPPVLSDVAGPAVAQPLPDDRIQTSEAR